MGMHVGQVGRVGIIGRRSGGAKGLWRYAKTADAQLFDLYAGDFAAEQVYNEIGNPALDTDAAELIFNVGPWEGKTLDQFLAAQTQLVTNGSAGFADTTDWTANGGATISVVNGELVIEAQDVPPGDGAGDRAEYSFSGLVEGGYYLTTISAYIGVDGPGVEGLAQWTWAGANFGTWTTTLETRTRLLEATDTSGVSRFYATSTGGDGTEQYVVASFSNLYTGKGHLRQLTSADAPTVEIVGETKLLDFPGGGEHLDATVAGNDAATAGKLTVSVSVQGDEDADIVALYAEGNNSDGDTKLALRNGDLGNRSKVAFEIILDDGTVVCAAGDTLTTSDVFDGNRHVLTCMADLVAGNVKLKVDGILEVDYDFTPPVGLTLENATLGGWNSGGNVTQEIKTKINGVWFKDYSIDFTDAEIQAIENAVNKNFGVDLDHTAYTHAVDGVNGSDLNSGAPGDPWQTLTPLRNYVDSTAADGEQIKAIVHTATYTDQHLSFATSVSGVGVNAYIQLDDDVRIEWTLGTDASGIQALDDLNLTVKGRPNAKATVTGFNVGTGNGGASHANATVLFSDIISEGNVDGFSAHGNSDMTTLRCEARDNSKSAFAHIDTATVTHTDDIFEAQEGASLEIGFTDADTNVTFNNCALLPKGVSDQVRLGGTTTIVGGQIGTLTESVDIEASGPTTIDDTFVHGFIDGNAIVTMTRPYGFVSTRQRNDGGRVIVDNGHFAGPAEGYADSALFAGYDALSQGGFIMRNTILTGYDVAIGRSFTADYVVYFISANGLVTHVNFFDNTTDINALLISAGADVSTGHITTDPQVGSKATVNQADWAIAVDSPCVGAGLNGADIGFQV